MKIAISGCGIAGTTVGFLLAEQGHQVTIFEQAAECQPVGAGILLQPSGQQVLKRLKLFDDIAGQSERLGGLTAVKANGKPIVELRYDLLDHELFGLGVHRGKLFQILFERCKHSGVHIQTGQRVTNFSLDSHGLVSLETATQKNHELFDFLIAADGSRSALRSSTKGIKQLTIDYEYAALWTTGSCSYQPGKLVQFVNGTTQLAGLLPIGNGHSSFFWGIPADEFKSLTSKPINEWKSQVLRLCPPAESILSAIQKFEQLTFARYQHVMMRKHFSDKIIFLGDAAHATSPHLGQGVNLALEDAEMFSQLIGDTNNFEKACQLFHEKRSAKIKYVQQVTRILTPFFQADGLIKGKLRDTFLPWFPKTPFVRREMIRTLCGFKNSWLN